MNLFAISDLHLSFGVDKPMNVFRGWENHTERIAVNWKRLVAPEDTVILAGDTSWALKTEESKKDFEFIESLPGKKILLKGNHDLWWGTAKKLKEFFKDNNFNSIELLFNNCYFFDDIAVCGSRGWLYDGTSEKDEKVIKRECGRLELSLKPAIEAGKKPILFLHYPPVYGDFVCEEIFEVIKRYGITQIYYGHIHGNGFNKSVSEYDGVKMRLISCDCVDFTPVFVGQYMENL